MIELDNNSNFHLIEFQNVTFIRNSRKILDNFNLILDQGENVAILGPNGAGKSSLLKIITREYYPSATSSQSYIRILGQDLWDVFELRKKLGIVHNDILKNSYGEFSCYETVVSGFFSSSGIWNHSEITPEMKNKTTVVMKFLGISHLVSRSRDEISSGEFRLVLIARALVHEPSMLLLDEPTSNLDPKASGEIRDTLRRIIGQGKNIVMITHNLSDIIPEITRIIFIRKGQIVGDADKDKLLNSSSLSNLFGTRIDVIHRNGYYHSV